MRALALLALLALLVAGCGSPGKSPEAVDPFAGAPQAAAGKGVLRGVVINSAITPVVGATVQLTGDAAGGAGPQTTDTNGAFVFVDLAPGLYFVSVSKPGWTTAQASADVVADVDEPTPLKVLIDRVPGTEPRAETVRIEGFIACSFGTYVNYGSCAVNQEESPEVYADFQGVPSFVQTELVWDSTQPSGDWMYVVQGVCTCDGGVPDVGEGRFDEVYDATSPYIARADQAFLTEWKAGTDNQQVVISVSASGPEPATTNGSGVAVNQAFEAYITIFYNLPDPDPNWSFYGNGPYPVPPPA